MPRNSLRGGSAGAARWLISASYSIINIFNEIKMMHWFEFWSIYSLQSDEVDSEHFSEFPLSSGKPILLKKFENR